MKILFLWFVLALKKIDLGSALAVRLTKLTGKSKIPIHPKHFLSQTPWFTKYIEKSDWILDLGCGNGQNSIKAAKIAKKVVACDIDWKLINQAQTTARLAKVVNIEWQQINLENKLKFKASSFNKVIFLDVLEHLRNRKQILTEIRRILKPSALLFIGVPNKNTSWKKFQRSAGVCYFSDPDHKIEFSENYVRKLLRKHKFKILKLGYSKFDIPARGLVDIIGALSLTFYKFISEKREKLAQIYPNEASGFEIVAKKI